MRGKTIVGEKVTPWETMVNSVTPLAIQDIVEAWKSERGHPGIVAPAALLGVGVSTYRDRGWRQKTYDQMFKRMGE
jgi:hypothetical protein